MGVTGVRNAIAATVGTEFLVRIRNRASFVQILLLAGLCAALAPSPDAAYAIVKFGTKVPEMSIDTAFLAAAVVLNLLLVGMLSLVFDQGRLRDWRSNLAPLFHTQPANSASLASGRMTSVVAFGFLTAGIAAVLLSSTLAVRFGTLPDPMAYLLFGVLVAPAILIAALLGAIIDLFIPPSAIGRSMAALFLWTAIVVSSLQGGIDFVGVGALTTLANQPLETGIALGFVPTAGALTLPWYAFDDAGLVLRQRAIMTLTLSIACFAFAAIAAFRLRSAARPRIAGSWQKDDVVSDKLKRTADADQPKPAEFLNGAPHKTAGLATAMLLVWRRLAGRSPFWLVLLLAGIVAGLAPLQPAFGLTLVLCSAFAVVTGNTVAEIRVASSLERCEPALMRPNPETFHALVVTAAMALAALPALTKTEPVQASTALLAMFVYAKWLLWTHRTIDRPILGVGVAGLALYVVAFNNVPAPADILGLWQSSSVALTTIGLIAMLVAFGLRSNRSLS